MQVVVVFALGIVAAFVGFFVVSNVQDSLENLSIYRKDRSVHYEATAARSASGSEAVPNVVYPGATTVSVLRELPNTSRFQELFNRAAGESLFSASGLYTFFIPTDSVFETAADALKAGLDSLSDEEARRLVAYHIVPEKMIQVGVPKFGWIQTLSGDMLNFELRKRGGTAGNARILAAYIVDNGIVYIVDQILLPPEKVSY